MKAITYQKDQDTFTYTDIDTPAIASKPPKHHAHRHAYGNIIAHAQEVEIAAPRHPQHRKRNADQTAMKAHAAVPHPQQLPTDQPVA